MRIQKSKMYAGTFTYDYLKTRGYSLFFKVMNEYVALKPGAGNQIEKVPPVVLVKTEKDIPLWKQSMDFMLTGQYKSKECETMAYRTNELTQGEKQRGCFFVYEIIR